MSKLRVQSFAISIDGYGAGPNQNLQNPLGVRGPELMEWFFPTRVWRKMQRLDGGETGVDNGIAEHGLAGIGAWILGRNMFGPVRGPWPDESWKACGATSRHTTRPASCPRIIRRRHSRLTEGRRFASSPKGSKPLWSWQRPQR